jgi:hypothetical protein
MQGTGKADSLDLPKRNQPARDCVPVCNSAAQLSNQIVVQIDQKNRGPCGPQLAILISDSSAYPQIRKLLRNYEPLLS